MTNTATDKTLIDVLAAGDSIFVDDTSASNTTKRFTPTQMVAFAEANPVQAILKNAANTYDDGKKQTFNPDATNPGINVGAQAGNPSSLVDGDIWLNSSSNQAFMRINGANVDIGAGAGGGDAWSDVVDAVITPDADGTRDFATTGTRFATGYFDNLTVTTAISATTFTGAVTGNASTATALETARTIGGVSFDGTANIVPDTITFANEATDTTCFVTFATAATGDLQPRTNTNLTYNSNTGLLGVTGSVTVDNLTINGNTITADTGALNLTPAAGSAIVLDGTINVDAGVVTGATSVTSTSFVGALTGNADTATALETARTIGGVSFDGTANIVPTTIAVTDTTDTTCFVALFESATGDLLPQTDAGITYNAGTGSLAPTILAATGAVSGSNLSGTNTGDEATASVTVSGISELATTAEVDTGTDTGRTITPDALAGSYAGTKSGTFYETDPTADLTTGNGKAYLHIPASIGGMNLVTVHAEVITAGTTGTLDIQIHNLTQAADMLSTVLTVDSGETGSDTAATPAVIDTANDDVATNDVIRLDIDAVHTTAAKGLIVTLEFRLP